MWGLSIYAVLILGSMATMSIGIGVVLASMIWACGGPKKWSQALRAEFHNPGMRLYLLAATVLTLALAISEIVAWIHPLGYAGWFVEVRFWKDMAKAWYLFWPLILATALRLLDDDRRSIVLRTWILAFAMMSLIGIQQYFTGWPRPQAIPQMGAYHATVFLGHHLSLSSIFIFPYFVVLDLIVSGKGKKLAKLSRGFLIAIAVAGLLVLFATYSRMLWLALPVGLAIWGVLSLPKKWGIAAASAILLSGIVLYQVPEIQKRVHAPMGVKTRLWIWKANLEFFKQRPWTGTGWHHNMPLSRAYAESRGEKSKLIGHAHNNVLEMLGGTGVIGLLAWLFWVVAGVCLLWPAFRQNAGFATGLLCAWIVFHLNGMTQVNFWESKVIHQMMWVTAWTLLWYPQLRGTRILRR